MRPSISRARDTILNALIEKGVYQFRYTVNRNSKGTKRISNRPFKIAMLQLNEEKALRITGKRIFSCAACTGVNYTMVKEP